MGYRPVNKYLPPRPRRDAVTSGPRELPRQTGSAVERLFAWADRLLSSAESKQSALPQEDYSGRLEG
jgi:hypothetical protein